MKWLALMPLVLLSGCSLSKYPLLDPAGPVGTDEKHLIIIAFLLMLIPVVPVIVMTIWFSLRYHSTHERSTYKPNWAHSNKIELTIWLVPILIVLGLSILTFITTYELNPYKPLTVQQDGAAATAKPVRVDVIGLDWKWLFIYPEEHVAVVNQLVVPTHRPINIRLTSDTVMTSFFIPRLGTQIYAMAGMQTKLHLLSDRQGTFFGLNTQISGKGYAGMHFKVISTDEKGYQAWLKKVRQSPNVLDVATYEQLEKPSEYNPVQYYSNVIPDDLFADVIAKYRGGHHTLTALANDEPATMDPAHGSSH